MSKADPLHDNRILDLYWEFHLWIQHRMYVGRRRVGRAVCRMVGHRWSEPSSGSPNVGCRLCGALFTMPEWQEAYYERVKVEHPHLADSRLGVDKFGEWRAR